MMRVALALVGLEGAILGLRSIQLVPQVQDLSRLVETMGDDAFGRRYRKLSAGLGELIEDYGLVNYTPLAIEDKDSVAHVLALVDKATGYVFKGSSSNSPQPRGTPV